MITRLRYVEYFDYKYIVFLSDHLISPQKKISSPGSWRPFCAARRVGLCRSKQSNSGRVISYYYLLYIDIIIYHADIYVASVPNLMSHAFPIPQVALGVCPQNPEVWVHTESLCKTTCYDKSLTPLKIITSGKCPNQWRYFASSPGPVSEALW